MTNYELILLAEQEDVDELDAQLMVNDLADIGVLEDISVGEETLDAPPPLHIKLTITHEQLMEILEEHINDGATTLNGVTVLALTPLREATRVVPMDYPPLL